MACWDGCSPEDGPGVSDMLNPWKERRRARIDYVRARHPSYAASGVLVLSPGGKWRRLWPGVADAGGGPPASAEAVGRLLVRGLASPRRILTFERPPSRGYDRPG